MENTEKTTVHNNYEHFEENTGDNSYSLEEQETGTLQAQHESKEIVPESAYGSIDTQPYQEDGLSAVDLRTTRPPNTINPSDIFCNIDYHKNKEDAISTACLFTNFNSNNLHLVNISSDSQVQNPTEKANYTTSNLESVKDDFNKVSDNQYISYQKIDSQKKYTLKKFSFNGPVVWNSENNVDFVLLVDQETQTQVNESKEASAQTDKYTNKFTYPLLKKKNLSNINYSCLICQRFYTSKSSYDRHARTHVENGNVVTNLHIAKKAKFMIYDICKSQLPMTLQKPRLTKFQCGICCKSFSSQVARDDHRDNFVLEEFPVTKCKECHVKFFTLGALHEHVKFVHESNTHKCNAYRCIFCNESFEYSFSFQLHLDEHLSTQINS